MHYLFALLTEQTTDEFNQRWHRTISVHHIACHHDALPGIPAALPVPPLPASRSAGADLQHRPPRGPARARRVQFPFCAALEQWTELPLLHSAPWCHVPHSVFASVLRGGHHEDFHGWGSHWALSRPSASLRREHAAAQQHQINFLWKHLSWNTRPLKAQMWNCHGL